MRNFNKLQIPYFKSSLYRVLTLMVNGCHLLFLQAQAIGQKINVPSAAQYVKAYFLLLAFAFLGNASPLVAQCPPGNISFKNQAEVDDFATNFPNCTTINGNVTIGDLAGPGAGVNITDLSPLNGIATITGNLLVHSNDDLTDLNGLTGLTSIGNSLIIQFNSKLTNLNGLSGLGSIVNNLIIQFNSKLPNLNGLSGLGSIVNNLIIQVNSKLPISKQVETSTSMDCRGWA